MGRYVVASASLRPPPEPAGVLDGSSGVLLEQYAYIAARVNATTARAFTRCGKEIQVTLCLADPPRVSYVCVCCPTADFFCEPRVVAMEGDLLLLNLMLNPPSGEYHQGVWHYFIYKASSSPSLDLLPPPQFDDAAPAEANVLCPNEVGLLRTNTAGGGGSYIIAFIQVLLRVGRSRSDICWDVLLCLFDSSNGHWEWKRKLLQVDPQFHQFRGFFQPCSKVLAIGGQASTMAWVNFENGMFLCDVLQESPILRRIPLPPPPPLLPGAFYDDSSQTRDIDVVHGRIKFVDLIFRCRPDRPDGWVAVTWSRKAASAAADDAASSPWELEDDHTLKACDINCCISIPCLSCRATMARLSPPWRRTTLVTPRSACLTAIPSASWPSSASRMTTHGCSLST